MLRTTVALAVLSLAPTLPGPRPPQDELGPRLRAVAGAFCEEESIGAMTVAVHVGGERVFAGAFGEAGDAPSGRRLGFEAVALDGLAGRSAGGALFGGRAHVAAYGEPELWIAILCDAPKARVDRLERRLARMVLGLEPPEIVDEPLAAEERARYVGSYYVGCSEYRVSDDGRRLVVHPPDGAPYGLRHQEGLRFVSVADDEVEIEFQRTGDAVTGLWLDERGSRVEGRRR